MLHTTYHFDVRFPVAREAGVAFFALHINPIGGRNVVLLKQLVDVSATLERRLRRDVVDAEGFAQRHVFHRLQIT